MIISPTPANLERCELRLMLVAWVEPFDRKGVSTQALRSGVAADRLACRIRQSGGPRELAVGQKRRG